MTPYTAMEPLLHEQAVGDVEDLAIDLVAWTNGLAGALHPVMRDSLGPFVRAMNCYYSNLIEGHNAHPIDIERALVATMPPSRRSAICNMKRAHNEVQALIDAGAAPSPVVSQPFIRWVHREFCERLPDSLLRVSDPDSGAVIVVEPGEFRRDHVRVGRHIAPAPDDIEFFMARFVGGYTSSHLSRFRKVIAVGAAHHRLLWIHPFADGNGRVARLAVASGGRHHWEFPRGKAMAITGYKERQARTVVSQLLDMGLLSSPNAKGPLRLAFPAKIVDRWFPRLYPAL